MVLKSRLTVVADTARDMHPYIVQFWHPHRDKPVALNAGDPPIYAGPTTSTDVDIQGIFYIGEDGIARDEYFYFACSNPSFGWPTVTVQKQGPNDLKEEPRVQNMDEKELQPFYFHFDGAAVLSIEFARLKDSSEYDSKEFEMRLRYSS